MSLYTTLPSITFHYDPDSSKLISLFLEPMKYKMMAANVMAPLTVKFANVK